MSDIEIEPDEHLEHEGGGPAFPSNVSHPAFPGLTRQEFFAAHVIQGLLACERSTGSDKDLVERAFELADLMVQCGISGEVWT